jgi:hypothetical protein
MSGMKATESWRCPALVSRASGRQPEPASRRTLVVTASRSAGTSFGGSRRAPAACWCARTTVASAATVHAAPSA